MIEQQDMAWRCMWCGREAGVHELRLRERLGMIAGLSARCPGTGGRDRTLQ
jgi:hypothetical protein